MKVRSLTSLGLIILGGIIFLAARGIVPGDQLFAQNPKARVLIVYFSAAGNTEEMARGVAEGVQRVAGVEVLVRTVEKVTKGEVESAAGLILGSPVYYANMAAPMKQFIDNWYSQKIILFDKVGGAFATGGGLTAGRETTVNSLLLAMLNNGMIVVGPLYESWGTFGSSARTAPPDEGVNEEELEDARRLGERVARVVLKLQEATRY